MKTKVIEIRHYKVNVTFVTERTALGYEDAEESVRAAICDGMGWDISTPMLISAVLDIEKTYNEDS